MIDPTTTLSCSNEQPDRPVRVALAHDWLVAKRGGELVLDAIARSLSRMRTPIEISRLYLMFDSRVPITETIDALPRTVSEFDALPAPLRRWLLPAYPAAVASLSRKLARDHAREPIQLLISTSSAAIKGIKTPPGVPHLCYCHTPARYLWSQSDAYTQGGLKGIARGVGLGMFKDALREWDRETSDRVDLFVANSNHTRDEIERSYQRDAAVISPPVRTDFFTPDTSVERDGSLLVVSALEPYKRIDHAIRVAAETGRRLIVIGSGSHEASLRSLAAGTRGASVVFVGHADDQAVRDAMRRAHAFLMPQVEDFGITCIEAQSCGTPVVAKRAGGALDTVLDGVTGVLVSDDKVPAWSSAIDRCNPLKMGISCRRNAERFAAESFENAIQSTVKGLLGG